MVIVTKLKKVAGPSEVCVKMIFSSEVELNLVMEFCQLVLVPIFKGKRSRE